MCLNSIRDHWLQRILFVLQLPLGVYILHAILHGRQHCRAVVWARSSACSASATRSESTKNGFVHWVHVLCASVYMCVTYAPARHLEASGAVFLPSV